MHLLAERWKAGLAGYLVLIISGLFLPILAVIGYLGIALYHIIPSRGLSADFFPKRLRKKVLVVHATADACVYESDARTLCDAVAAQDKSLEFIKADHYLTEPAGARAQAANLISAWVTSRS